jgi:hypothetical protein
VLYSCSTSRSCGLEDSVSISSSINSWFNSDIFDMAYWYGISGMDHMGICCCPSGNFWGAVRRLKKGDLLRTKQIASLYGGEPLMTSYIKPEQLKPGDIIMYLYKYKGKSPDKLKEKSSAKIRIYPYAEHIYFFLTPKGKIRYTFYDRPITQWDDFFEKIEQ